MTASKPFSLLNLCRWRTLRWGALAVAAPALWACTSRSLEKPQINPTQTYQAQFQVTANRNIDLLFLVDNSSSMETLQANLTRNFPQFINVLSMIPDENGVPRLPNVHIAVITSDMGVGTDGQIDMCSANGNGGQFQFAEGPPPVTPCDPMLASGAHFIEDDGHGNTNYTGTLAATFSCIATTGATGCGFERQLSSMAHSLGADNFQNGQPVPPAGNEGFLRPDAYLGIILLTNEDDTSANNNFFYDVNQNDRQGTQLGPPGNFRGNHFGHVCDGANPTELSPTGQTGNALITYQHCVSDESGTWLFPVGDFAKAIKALKTDPDNQILVASISGPTTESTPQGPYAVDWKTANVSGDPPWPYVEHSCPSPDATVNFADPGVRLNQFVQQFGANGIFQSICDTDFGPSLTLIAQKLSMLIKPPCIVGTLWQDPANNGAPDCAVTDHTPDGMGGTVDSILPACDNNGQPQPCYILAQDAATCGAGGFKVSFSRSGTPPDNLRTTVACRTCPPGINANGVVDPGCP
jgi:hypothetical protein